MFITLGLVVGSTSTYLCNFTSSRLATNL